MLFVKSESFWKVFVSIAGKIASIFKKQKKTQNKTLQLFASFYVHVTLKNE